jgi:hypothetical protein
MKLLGLILVILSVAYAFDSFGPPDRKQRLVCVNGQDVCLVLWGELYDAQVNVNKEVDNSQIVVGVIIGSMVAAMWFTIAMCHISYKNAKAD